MANRGWESTPSGRREAGPTRDRFKSRNAVAATTTKASRGMAVAAQYRSGPGRASATALGQASRGSERFPGRPRAARTASPNGAANVSPISVAASQEPAHVTDPTTPTRTAPAMTTNSKADRPWRFTTGVGRGRRWNLALRSLFRPLQPANPKTEMADPSATTQCQAGYGRPGPLSQHFSATRAPCGPSGYSGRWGCSSCSCRRSASAPVRS